MTHYNYSKALEETKKAKRGHRAFIKSDNIIALSPIMIGLTSKQGDSLYHSCLRYQNEELFQGYGYEAKQKRHKIKINDVLFYWPDREAA